MKCDHARRGFYKHVCSNGMFQARELCQDCGVNVRGAGINVLHAEVQAITGNTVAALPDDADAGPAGLFDGMEG